jgi:hypothetical protein
MDPYSPYSHDIPMIISLKKPRKRSCSNAGIPTFPVGNPQCHIQMNKHTRRGNLGKEFKEASEQELHPSRVHFKIGNASSILISISTPEPMKFGMQ